MARHRDGLAATDASELQTVLSDLPVTVLDSAAPHREVLASLGAHSLGQLMLLPRAGLARRFGPQLLREVDRAWGRAPEPRAWFEAAPAYTARLELPAAAEDAGALLVGARRLLSSLCGWLTARHAAAQSITLSAQHDDPPATTLELQPADPTADEARLATLLRERLAVTRLRAPAHTLRIDCGVVVPVPAGSGALFPMPTPARENIARLIEQLQARLGRDRVLRLAPQADHRPETACRLERATIDALSAATASRAAEDTMPAGGGALPRPTWLLAQPQPLAERQQRPWLGGPLVLLAGPERIETGWWDGHLVQRDYFIAADDDGLLLWIYRERPVQGRAEGGWFLQGRYG
jgi:protein ImuB